MPPKLATAQLLTVRQPCFSKMAAKDLRSDEPQDSEGTEISGVIKAVEIIHTRYVERKTEWKKKADEKFPEKKLEYIEKYRYRCNQVRHLDESLKSEDIYLVCSDSKAFIVQVNTKEDEMQKKDQLIYMRDLIESLYQVVLPAYYNSTCVSSSKVKNLRRILDLQRKLEKRILNSTGQGSGSECVSAEEAYLFTGGVKREGREAQVLRDSEDKDDTKHEVDDSNINDETELGQDKGEVNEPMWEGQLPLRNYENPVYSKKIFLGGVPQDITEADLQQAFCPFGPVRVEWPGKEGQNKKHPPKGYVYLLFEIEKSVKSLLDKCTHKFSYGGDWYYKISSRTMREKEVQVIPWVLSDSDYALGASPKLDRKKTVFVGGLHGKINAEALSRLMSDLFGGVIYAGIDTDKNKYPIGSGSVAFNNHDSFRKAVQAAFIKIKTPKFTKRVQIDPYHEESMCNICHISPGPFFCREPQCFRYFCSTCWDEWHHSTEGHRLLTLYNKNSTSGY